METSVFNGNRLAAVVVIIMEEQRRNQQDGADAEADE